MLHLQSTSAQLVQTFAQVPSLMCFSSLCWFFNKWLLHIRDTVVESLFFVTLRTTLTTECSYQDKNPIYTYKIEHRLSLVCLLCVSYFLVFLTVKSSQETYPITFSYFFMLMACARLVGSLSASRPERRLPADIFCGLLASL